MTTYTGGFVARAERQTGVPLASPSGPNLGPGSYELIATPVLAPAPVPFLSSKERNAFENTGASATSPGPGAYEAIKAKDVVQLKHIDPRGSTSMFASHVERLYTDKSGAWQPGPGTYTEGNVWLKRSHHYTPPASKQRVHHQRTTSAPSIPARDQSYGYEEGLAGTLVQQRPTETIFTGVGRDKVGPGAYDLANAGPAPAQKAVQWCASRTKRSLMVTSTTPGPGQYEAIKDAKHGSNGIVVNINGVDVQFGGAAGTSQFVSRVPTQAQKVVQDWERTPGPGAYDPQSMMGSAPLPREMQCFGSSTRRDVDPMRSLAAPTFYRNPGPGAYNTPIKGVTIMQQSLSDPRPFNATSQRFGSNANGIPGPGEYRPDQLVNLAKSITDKAAISKGGVFGSNTARWGPPSSSPHAAEPGPGRYEPRLSAPKPVHRGNDAAFASEAARFKAHPTTTAIDTSDVDPDTGAGIVRGDPSSLGPGCYQLPDNWGRKGRSYRAPAFGSDAGRSAPAGPGTGSSPGPGRYNLLKNVDQALKPMTNPRKDTVFGSQVSRFKASGPYSPGPGHYALAGDMKSKTYNITYQAVA